MPNTKTQHLSEVQLLIVKSKEHIQAMFSVIARVHFCLKKEKKQAEAKQKTKWEEKNYQEICNIYSIK